MLSSIEMKFNIITGNQINFLIAKKRLIKIEITKMFSAKIPIFISFEEYFFWPATYVSRLMFQQPFSGPNVKFSNFSFLLDEG